MLEKREVDQGEILNQVVRVDLTERVTVRGRLEMVKEAAMRIPGGERSGQGRGPARARCCGLAGVFKEQQGGKPCWRRVSEGEEWK